MEGTEVRKLAALEDAHWWYRERRHLLRRTIAGMHARRALDIGAAGGGNTRVLQAARMVGGRPGVRRGRRRAWPRERGLAVLRGDATALPGRRRLASTWSWPSTSSSTSSTTTPRWPRCCGRCGRAGGSSSRCPPTRGCGPSTTSRSTTSGATPARRCGGAGAGRVRRSTSLTSWNVLLRPVVACAGGRRAARDLDTVHPVVNAGLRAIVTVERYLPVKAMPGGDSAGSRRVRGLVTGPVRES